MQHQEFDPPEELRDVIKCFWYNKRSFGEGGANFEVVPDGYAEIIFHFGGGCSLINNGNLEPLPSPFIMGLLNQPALFYAENNLEIIGVRCFPWTVFDLLGLPSSKEFGVQLIEHPIAGLQPELSKLVHEESITEALAAIKQYFLEARLGIRVDSMLYKAGVAMQEAGGTLPVSKVALSAHATVRTLERKFKASAGYTVKDISALMRFEKVRNSLWLNPDTRIAGLAYELGYADQSHLSKEFKRFSGVTPAAFARKAKKAKQVISKDFVAFVQS